MDDGRIFRRLREGVVERVSKRYTDSIPYGFIRDDDPSFSGPVYFMNDGGAFEVGAKVVYRCKQGDPFPVAIIVWPRADFQGRKSHKTGGYTSRSEGAGTS